MCLYAAPGFVACLLMETASGGHAAVYIFEDPASLAAANGLVAGWSPAAPAGAQAGPWGQIGGEVVAQRGL